MWSADKIRVATSEAKANEPLLYDDSEIRDLIDIEHESRQELKIQVADLRAALIRSQEIIAFSELKLKKLMVIIESIKSLEMRINAATAGKPLIDRIENAVAYVEQSKSAKHYQDWTFSFRQYYGDSRE